MISLQNVSKIYKMGETPVRALDYVNLNLGAGDFVAITGPSGSGKSTLLNVIGGLDRPTTGDIFFDNLHLNKLSDREISAYRNSRVGFIFQTFNLEPSLTALENVALPLLLGGVSKKERNQAAGEILSWLGLSERLFFRPNKLSGGERQRVAIARALICRPSIILADEPTGNLDSGSRGQILEILASLNQTLGVTVLLVTHDLEAANIAPRVLKMMDGRII